MIGRRQAERGSRAGQPREVPADREGAGRGDLERLEDAVTDHQPVVGRGDGRLVTAAVQPAVDPDGPAAGGLRDGIGEQWHQVRVAARSLIMVRCARHAGHRWA